MKNNSLAALNNHLFEALERVQQASPEELEQEISRAKTVSDIGDKIIRNAALGLKAVEILGKTEVPSELRIETVHGQNQI
jgi:hypothetical protein